MARATNAVGRNVLRKEGVEKVTGAARYIDDLPFPDLLHARTIRSTIPGRRDCRHPLRFRHRRLHHRRPSRHSRPQRRRADRRRSAVPGRADDSPRRGADPAAGARGSRDAARGRGADRLPARDAGLRSRQSSTTVFKHDRDRQGQHRRRASPRPTSIVEGEYRIGHQEQLYIEPNGVVAVPGATASITVYGSMQCPVLRASRARRCCSGCPTTRCASFRPRPAAGSAARKSTRR